MEFYKGTKIWKIGKCDEVYAPDEESAKQVMVDMMGPEDTEELIADEFRELTEEEFNNKMIYWDDEGDISREVKNNNSISYQQALDNCLSDGSLSGHFSTSEW